MIRLGTQYKQFWFVLKSRLILVLSCLHSLLLELQGDTVTAIEAYETMLGSMVTTSDLTEVWCRYVPQAKNVGNLLALRRLKIGKRVCAFCQLLEYPVFLKSL